jgi:hypothetical protein
MKSTATTTEKLIFITLRPIELYRNKNPLLSTIRQEYELNKIPNQGLIQPNEKIEEKVEEPTTTLFQTNKTPEIPNLTTDDILKEFNDEVHSFTKRASTIRKFETFKEAQLDAKERRDKSATMTISNEKIYSRVTPIILAKMQGNAIVSAYWAYVEGQVFYMDPLMQKYSALWIPNNDIKTNCLAILNSYIPKNLMRLFSSRTHIAETGELINKITNIQNNNEIALFIFQTFTSTLSANQLIQGDFLSMLSVLSTQLSITLTEEEKLELYQDDISKLILEKLPIPGVAQIALAYLGIESPSPLLANKETEIILRPRQFATSLI